jgi:hypothetical protein
MAQDYEDTQYPERLPAPQFEQSGDYSGEWDREKSNRLTISDSRFKHGATNPVETSTLFLQFDETNDDVTLTAKINDAQIMLNAYKAVDLLNYLDLHRASILALADKKNHKAEDAEARDMNTIRKEWRDYRNEGLGERG